MSEPDDEGHEETRTSDVVLIKKPECLTCTHLVRELGTEEYTCYGTRHCPAVTYQIAIGLDILETSDALAKAWSANDIDTVTKIMGKLSQVHAAVRNKVMTLAKSNPRGT